MLKTLAVLFACAALSGCISAREPAMVQAVLSTDSSLTCEQLSSEYRENTRIAAQKIERNRKADIQEIFLGVLIWPGLIDGKNADGNEGNALLDRNVWLRTIAMEKGCDLSSLPKQPDRY